MASYSDKSPAGASESSHERADEQSARKFRPNDADLPDLEDPRSDQVKGGIPKQPDATGTPSLE